jgi:hypothetical protein
MDHRMFFNILAELIFKNSRALDYGNPFKDTAGSSLIGVSKLI